MLVFQTLANDPTTKYQTGWSLIALIVIIMAFNLAIVIKVTIQNAIKKCKLRHKRKQN